MNQQKFMRQWCMTDNTTDFQSEESCSNQDCRIILDLVNNETNLFSFKQIVKNYHTYKPSTELVGRCINWLIRKEKTREIIGAIGVGSSVMAMKPRDDFIGWNKEQRLKNLTKTCTNWRFCLMEKGYGSKVLSVLLKEVKKEWFKKFGNKLVLIETLVEPPYNGTCYKANGWKMVGKTKGYQFEWKHPKDVLPTDQIVQKYFLINGKKDCSKWKVVIGSNKPKYIFVKPLHRYWKKELKKM